MTRTLAEVVPKRLAILAVVTPRSINQSKTDPRPLRRSFNSASCASDAGTWTNDTAFALPPIGGDYNFQQIITDEDLASKTRFTHLRSNLVVRQAGNFGIEVTKK